MTEYPGSGVRTWMLLSHLARSISLAFPMIDGRHVAVDKVSCLDSRVHLGLGGCKNPRGKSSSCRWP